MKNISSNTGREICVISTVHQIYDTRIYFKEILSLVNAGYIVNFIVKKQKILFDHPNIRFHFLPNRPGLWNRIKNIVLTIKLGNKINNLVYHIHDPELILVGLYYKTFKHKVVIYDIHELYHDELKYKPYFNKVFAHIVANIYRAVDWFATKMFDANILAEDKYRDYYNGNNFIVIQNYILSNYVVEKPLPILKESDKLQIVYVGSIRDVRGISEMLSFVHLLSSEMNFTFHLIGSFTPPILENEINDFISEYKLEEKIKVYGMLPFPEAQKIVKKCDIGLLFLHPILNNLTILATKMFEYMGNGLAVLMSDFPLWIEFNQNNNCGLTVNIFDLDNEKAKIQNFLNNRKQINQIKMSNIENVKNNFIWEIEEKKLINLYKEILN